MILRSLTLFRGSCEICMLRFEPVQNADASDSFARRPCLYERSWEKGRKEKRECKDLIFRKEFL